jgi:hypothetical protein
MTSPRRLMKLGLSLNEVAYWVGVTVEELEAQLDAEESRHKPEPPQPAGKTMMTRLLARPEMDRWETRTAERL